MSELLQAQRKLLAYTMWADREFLSVLRSIPEEHLLVDTGTSYGTLLATAAHVLCSERLWLSRFLGNAIDGETVDSFPDLASLNAGFADLWSDLEFFLASLSADQLVAEVAWMDNRGVAHSRPLWQPLSHLVQHSGYHRGQLASMLRQLGHEPPNTGLIAYLMEH